MEISQALSLRIREILKERKLSQYKLEQMSGISHNTMSFLLNCKYKAANIKTVFVIIESLGMTVKEFFDSPLFDFEDMNIN